MTIYDHFWPFFGNYINIFHKTEIQTVILRCLVSQNLNWIKSYNIIWVKKIIMPACASPVCQSEFWPLLRKSALIFLKWPFFQNSLKLSWATFTITGKKMKKNSELFTNKISECTFVLFVSKQSSYYQYKLNSGYMGYISL